MGDREGSPFPQDYFTRTYDRAEPRDYLRALAPLGYRQPGVVADYLLRHGAAVAAARGRRRLRVLDFGCGYGVTGCLLTHELTMDQLYARFAEDPADRAAGDPVAGDPVAGDRAFFAARRRPEAGFEVGGLDVAGNAVAYGEACGFLGRGFTEDLTLGPPGPDLAGFMASADLIFETGAVYAILLQCLSRLLGAAGGQGPWLLLGPRGDADTRDLWQALEARGYRIEVCTRAPQRYRRVLHDGERADAERLIRARGGDPAEHLRDGWFVNPLILARPEAQAAALPVDRFMV